MKKNLQNKKLFISLSYQTFKTEQMKKIEKLTPEQEAKLEVYRDKWLSKLFNYDRYRETTFEMVEQRMKELYKFSNLSEPKVIWLESPFACQKACHIVKKLGKVPKNLKKLMDETPNSEVEFESFSSYINYSDFAWLAYYDFFNNEFDILEEHSENINKIISFVDVSFMQIQLEKVCIVSKYPNLISRNADNDLHNTKDFAIKFDDGYGQHYVNGRFIEPEIFNECSDLQNAKICFHNQENEDIKACIITIIQENFGNEGVLEMLDAVKVDEKVLEHGDGYKETLTLYKTKKSYSFLQDSKGNLNVPYAWLGMNCPSTGNHYLISTCPTFDDVIECAKWHRPEIVPTSVDYKWMSAN